MRLKQTVDKQINPELAKKHSVPILALPRMEKVTLNVGVGPFKENKESLGVVEKQFAEIAGQKPKATTAKISISGFKVRKDQHIGYAVTLRGKRMWDFIERLNSVVLPRQRDFEGIPEKSFDKNGNFTLGVREQVAFPEIKSDEVRESFGMSITFTIKNTNNRELLKEYLKNIGFILKSDPNLEKESNG